MKGEALGDELAPPLDSSAEAVARRKLYAAMLSAIAPASTIDIDFFICVTSFKKIPDMRLA